MITLCKRNLISFFFLLLLLPAKPQVSQSVIIDKVNTKGLTNQFISALFQDQKGYLWVGTLGGLNKYNGYGFTKYYSVKTDKSTLSNPAITCFHQSNANTILVGTRKGLNIYNYVTDNFARVILPDNTKNADAKNNIHCLLSLKNGDVAAGTSDGILLLNPKTRQLQTITYNEENLMEGWTVQSMCLDRLGNLWMGAKTDNEKGALHRVFRYNFSTQNLMEIPIINESEHIGISEDYLGNIWVSANNGLICINPGTLKPTFYPAPRNFYSSVAYTHTQDNTIWQCYWSFGLTSFDIDRRQYKIYKNDPDNEKSLVSNKCWALLKDENDILWIGSDVGLQKITGKRPGIEVIRKNSSDAKNSFKGNIVTSLLVSKVQNDIVFAGIDGEGFSIYNRSLKQAKNYGPTAEYKNEERFVNQFIEDASGDVYVLGQNNLQKINFKNGIPAVKNYFTYQEHYSACGTEAPGDPGKLWIGGRGEVFCFDKQTQKTVFYKVPEGIENVFYCVFSSNGSVFFGHKNGLLKTNPTTAKFEKIEIADAGNIRNAVVVSENEVLLSSQFLGLIKYFPKTGKHEIVYREKNGYYPEPSSLMLYREKIWMTGNGGLTSLNHASGETTEITPDDGLPSPIVHKMDLKDGYFYLGTQDGLAILNPDLQVSHFITPKIDITKFVVLTDSTLFGNLKSGDEIILNEQQNSFRIDFTVLDFNLPERNHFKFRLYPLQENWQTPSNENFLIFNSLPAGSYKFELMGSNADRIWTLEPFVVNLKIVPPFYKTKWFYLVAFLLFVIAGIVFFYLKVRYEHKKQVLLEKVIKERTAEIQQQRAQLLDSITYAKRIQKAIFVGETELAENLPASFIYYKPKDRISGDFYWIGKYKDILVVFAGDCTGHGVPGAMLSIIGTSLLNKIVHEENICMPGEILTRLNYLFFNQLTLDVENVRDGMDASVLCINLVNHSVYFSGASLDALYISNNTITDLKAQRISIGESPASEYTTQSLPPLQNRTFYLFSDGIRDQHGGPNGKKLSMAKFKEILSQAALLPVSEQRAYISQTVSRWKAGTPQTDDMILIGCKI